MEGKKHVRPQIFRRRALDLSHRSQGSYRQGLAQSESAGPRGRGPGGDEGALNPRGAFEPSLSLAKRDFGDPLTLMRFALRSSTPAFAGLERWFMSLREGYPEARQPGSH